MIMPPPRTLASVWRWFSGGIVCSLALWTGWVQADGTTLMTVTVKVMVVDPPCIINDNKPIEVEFGDMLTTRVNGSTYLRKIEYGLKCEGAQNNKMKLQVRGNGASFDSNVLEVQQQPDLGIELLQGESSPSQLKVNDWLNFSYPDKPVLSAVPVKKKGATLGTGSFTAAATLAVDYQ